MPKKTQISMSAARAATAEQRLSQEAIAQAQASAPVLGRAHPAEVGASRPVQDVVHAIATPVAKANPVKRDGIKQTVLIEYDVWETMRSHIAEQRRRGVRGYSGQQVITAALKQFLGAEQ